LHLPITRDTQRATRRCQHAARGFEKAVGRHSQSDQEPVAPFGPAVATKRFDIPARRSLRCALHARECAICAGSSCGSAVIARNYAVSAHNLVIRSRPLTFRHQNRQAPTRPMGPPTTTWEIAKLSSAEVDGRSCQHSSWWKCVRRRTRVQVSRRRSSTTHSFHSTACCQCLRSLFFVLLGHGLPCLRSLTLFRCYVGLLFLLASSFSMYGEATT
jgi:hypothetical protein